MKKILLTIFIFTSVFLLAQEENFIIKGVVKDVVSQKRLPNVNLNIQGFMTGTVTNKHGAFSLQVDHIPLTIKISHIGYEVYYLKITEFRNQEKTILLTPKITELPEFEVGATQVKNITKDQPLHLFDYELFENYILFLAYHNKSKTEGRIFLVSYEGDTICYRNVEKPKKLFKDCFDNCHLITEYYSQQIYFDGEHIKLLYQNPIEGFYNMMEQCVEELGDKVYFQSYTMKGQFLNYSYYDKLTKNFQSLTSTAEEALFRTIKDFSRYKAAYAATGQVYGEYQTRFDNEIMFRPIFAPIVKSNDSIYFFNFTDDKLGVYDKHAELARETILHFHDERNWKPQLLVDEARNEVYTIRERNGISNLLKINTNKGTIESTYKIPEFTFVEKIRIHDGIVYFMYSERHNQFDEFFMYRHLFKMIL